MCICILECSDTDVICPEKWDIVLWSTVLILILSEIAGNGERESKDVFIYCFTLFLHRYGARCLSLSKIVPSICKLIEDQNSQVRVQVKLSE